MWSFVWRFKQPGLLLPEELTPQDTSLQSAVLRMKMSMYRGGIRSSCRHTQRATT